MDFTDLALRMVQADQGAIFQPYHFAGDWTDADKATLISVVETHCPTLVDSMFNNWRFDHHLRFSARRATWTMGTIHAETAAGLAQQISYYYDRQEKEN